MRGYGLPNAPEVHEEFVHVTDAAGATMQPHEGGLAVLESVYKPAKGAPESARDVAFHTVHAPTGRVEHD